MRNENNYSDQNLIRLQSVTWFAVFALFIVITLMYLINWRFADQLAQAGVIVILIATLLKLVIMADKFRKIKLKRLMILSYILLIILLSTALFKYWL